MRRLLRAMNGDRGSSLTELSTVVTVLGGVSALALITLTPLTKNANTVACQANQDTVRVAGLAYQTQSHLGDVAPNMSALVTSGFLRSMMTDVSYTVTTDGLSFEVRGAGPCAG